MGMNKTTKTLISILASKLRRGVATADETHEYEVLAALESASCRRPKPAHTIFDLPIARVLWTADAAEVRS